MSETNFTEQDRTTLIEATGRTHSLRTAEAINRAIAEIDSLRRESERLKTPPDAEAWRVLVRLAYADGGDGVQRIHSITSDYCRMRDERDSLRVQLGEAQKEREELGKQLEFDRTTVCDSMVKANRAIDSRHWLTEDRGSYEWNDDRWHDEFRAAAVEIKATLEPLTKIAANWAGCPVKAPEIAAARIDVKRQNDTLRAQLGEAQRAAIAEYIDAHGQTCDCCGHVMIDVSVVRDGASEQHCVAGDPEGDGSACAHGMHQDSERERQENATLRSEVEWLRSAVAWSYQMVGARWPNEQALDNLSDVLAGKTPRHEWPCVPPDTLRSEVERTKEALRLIQWGDNQFDPNSGEDGTMYHLCPRCDRSEVRGHAPDCEVGAALAGASVVKECLTTAPGDPFTAVWRCSCCGDMNSPTDSAWHWTGEAWWHKCPGDPQAGYFPARNFGHPAAQSETGGAA